MLEAIMNIIFYIPKKILAHFKRVQELDAEIARLDIDLRKACLFILDMASKAIEGEENNPYMKCVPQFREIRQIGQEAYLELNIKELLGYVDCEEHDEV